MGFCCNFSGDGPTNTRTWGKDCLQKIHASLCLDHHVRRQSPHFLHHFHTEKTWNFPWHLSEPGSFPSRCTMSICATSADLYKTCREIRQEIRHEQNSAFEKKRQGRVQIVAIFHDESTLCIDHFGTSLM